MKTAITGITAQIGLILALICMTIFGSTTFVQALLIYCIQGVFSGLLYGILMHFYDKRSID